MVQYLDKAGLTYLWGKIKSKFLMGNSGGVFYGTCSTAAGTTAKVVECADFTADNLKAGAIIIVTFTATNSGAVANLKLDVNSTGAKPIKYINNGTLGNLSSAGYIKANTEYPFYYDGANWVCWFNVNTTYSALSEADMHTGTATTARLITAQRLKQAVQYHAPVTSVNGSTGDVTVTVPTKTSELLNDGSDGVNAFITYPDIASQGYITATDLANPTFCATDSTTQAVLQQAFGALSEVVVPSDITSTILLLQKLEPRTWFAWMNGAELEFARMSVRANTGTGAITLYLRGRTSIATGVMGVDSSWTVEPISDADYVTEEGTESYWTYRRWHSGKVEAWRAMSFSSAGSTVWASPVRYMDKTFTIPTSIFDASATLHITATSPSNQYWIVGASTSGSATSSTISATLRVATVSSGNIATAANIYVWTD